MLKHKAKLIQKEVASKASLIAMVWLLRWKKKRSKIRRKMIAIVNNIQGKRVVTESPSTYGSTYT